MPAIQYIGHGNQGTTTRRDNYYYNKKYSLIIIIGSQFRPAMNFRSNSRADSTPWALATALALCVLAASAQTLYKTCDDPFCETCAAPAECAACYPGYGKRASGKCTPCTKADCENWCAEIGRISIATKKWLQYFLLPPTVVSPMTPQGRRAIRASFK
jgi:hypothetical protein